MDFKSTAAICFLFFVGAAYVSSTPDLEEVAEPDMPSLDLTIRDRPNAFTICRRAVESELVSPASAIFPSRETAYKISGQTYSANFTVDSQNGFGALIRSQIYCELEKTTSDRYGYSVSKLQIQQGVNNVLTK